MSFRHWEVQAVENVLRFPRRVVEQPKDQAMISAAEGACVVAQLLPWFQAPARPMSFADARTLYRSAELYAEGLIDNPMSTEGQLWLAGIVMAEWFRYWSGEHPQRRQRGLFLDGWLELADVLQRRFSIEDVNPALLVVRREDLVQHGVKDGD
jgi:hypothetical protein